jgi:CRP-like cAMP-binding protein
METAVLLNLSYPVSAQIAENATILSLPAPVFRERIKQDSDLATNFLTSMSYRSQGLINKLALSRLKTVDERVGWFLLKLALEQGHKSRYIELPYEKSLIASYLDMKRETFSRALKRFKQKGFKIENNRVILPAVTSLCEYCDQSLAEQCPRFNQDECCHYEFLKELEVAQA